MKQLVGRFLAFMILVSSLIAAAVLVEVMGPTEHTYREDSWDDVTPYVAPGFNSEKYNIVLDQHSHTLYSDGKLSVEDNIKWHISMGYNAIVITDHNTMENKEDIAELQAKYLPLGIIIIQGMEWTTGRLHMNFLGLDHWDLPIPGNPTKTQIQEAIDEAHSQGAVVTLNHIPWSTEQVKMADHPSRDEMREMGIDFIEIVNDDSLPPYVYDDESIPYCEENGIGQITGTDMHAPDGLEAGGVRGWTLINATEFSLESVMIELRAHNTNITYVENPFLDHGNYDVNPNYVWFKPMADFGLVFKNLYAGGVGDPVQNIAQVVAGIIGIFIITEVYRVIRIKFWLKLDNRKKLPINAESE